ncbi:MAG: CoB--CoM heterodisulfide reductase iron-sulfur subunit B family protein [Desulfomicrobium sp.]|jgi:heterodisulfide reductase subunit B|nr:CoB--CoM heterodisulfide reductase iron-sulfur subunit B family protein [Desulfomicrobium sp.]
MAKIAYYPGCSGLGTSVEYDSSTRAVCRALQVDLVDVEDWSCCGSSPAHTVNHVLSAALSARNLAQVEGMGLDQVATPCPSCLTNLRTAAHKMAHQDFRDQVNALLDIPCRTNVETKSVLQVFDEQVDPQLILSKVVNPLTGIKIACYYGCIMNRPPALMRFDDHENPMAMDRLMCALGAEVLPFPLKVECCGASYGIPRGDIVARLSGKLLDAARRLGADCLVTACPLCQMNLDLRQGQINRALGENFQMPVFYYTQLMGYALGLDRTELGLNKLCVDPHRVLGKIKQPVPVK